VKILADYLNLIHLPSWPPHFCKIL